MRKYCVALAALCAFSGAAMAQSSYTPGAVTNGVMSSNGARIGSNGGVASGVGVAETMPGSSKSTPNVGAPGVQGTEGGQESDSGSDGATR